MKTYSILYAFDFEEILTKIKQRKKKGEQRNEKREGD